MIHKFWNVRLAPQGSEPDEMRHDENASAETRDQVRTEEDHMESKVYRIWSVLSAFEESSAACISDMLLHVSNGAYMESVMVAKKFIWHVDILFGATDSLDSLIISEGMKRKSVSKVLTPQRLTNQPSRMEEKPSFFARRSSLSSLCCPNHKKPESES